MSTEIVVTRGRTIPTKPYANERVEYSVTLNVPEGLVEQEIKIWDKRLNSLLDNAEIAIISKAP